MAGSLQGRGSTAIVLTPQFETRRSPERTSRSPEIRVLQSCPLAHPQREVVACSSRGTWSRLRPVVIEAHVYAARCVACGERTVGEARPGWSRRGRSGRASRPCWRTCTTASTSHTSGWSRSATGSSHSSLGYRTPEVFRRELGDGVANMAAASSESHARMTDVPYSLKCWPHDVAEPTVRGR